MVSARLHVGGHHVLLFASGSSAPRQAVLERLVTSDHGHLSGQARSVVLQAPPLGSRLSGEPAIHHQSPKMIVASRDPSPLVGSLAPHALRPAARKLSSRPRRLRPLTTNKTIATQTHSICWASRLRDRIEPLRSRPRRFSQRGPANQPILADGCHGGSLVFCGGEIQQPGFQSFGFWQVVWTSRTEEASTPHQQRANAGEFPELIT